MRIGISDPLSVKGNSKKKRDATLSAKMKGSGNIAMEDDTPFLNISAKENKRIGSKTRPPRKVSEGTKKKRLKRIERKKQEVHTATGKLILSNRSGETKY